MSAPNSIGTYIQALFPLSQFDFKVGDLLETESDKEAYLYWIRERANQLERTDINDPGHSAEAIYKRTMKLLDRLQECRGCGTGISRSLWSALQTIVKLLACKSDWINLETGPIYGGSNATIAERLFLSVDRTKKILKELRARGLIIFHHRHANGRRWIRRRHDGRPIGHGFSLLPLLVMLEELEIHVAAWRQRKFALNAMFADIAGKLAGIKQSLRAAHGAQAKDHPAYINCEDQLRRSAKAKKMGDADALSQMLADLGDETPKKLQDSTLDGCARNPSLSNHPIKPLEVEAWQEKRSEEREADQDYGLESAKLGDEEITNLFPISEPYLKLHGNIDRASAHIAQDSALPQDLWRQMRQVLGVRAAIVTVLIIADRLAAGQIRTSSTAYAQGMLKAARRGNLQLGRTIWGRRELLAS